MNRASRADRGFTLYELMITLAVATILLTIAVPSFQEFIGNWRLSSQSNEIVSAVHFSRSTALSESVRVIACPTTDSATCDTGNSWGDGWMLFVDCNRDGDLNASSNVCINATPERMLREGHSTGGASLDASSNATLQFEPNGQVATAKVFTVCVDGMDRARQIIVNPVGRAQVTAVDAASNC
jgi:type IV fimbrial biogenesis protein FimT